MVFVHVAQRQRQMPQHGDLSPPGRFQHERQVVRDLLARLALRALRHKIEIVPLVSCRQLVLRADDKIELRQPVEQRLCIGKITRCLAELDAAADDDPAVGRAVGARKGLLPI